MSARNKCHIIVGTFGDRGHGKTTLTAALVGRWRPRDDMTRGKGYITYINPLSPLGACRYHDYETPSRYYSHVDSPCELDWIREELLGSTRGFERPGGGLAG